MVVNALLSIRDFEEYIVLPENLGKQFEYVRGEILEVVSNNYSSHIASRISYLIQKHMELHNIKGNLTGADGGYQIGDDRYMPDFGFISSARQPKPSHDAYNPLAPDLAVEVISPTDDEKKLRVKIANYLSENVTLWVVNPNDETVEIYQAGKPATILNKEQAISGAPVFPELNLAVKDIFPMLDDEA